MAKEITKEYTNGELTVVWKAHKCIHSEICVKTLPKVYDPKARPWIKPENASTKELQNQISKCPSGALTYYMNGEKPMEESTVPTADCRVDVLENGPLMVTGTITVVDKDGNETLKENKSFLCRCGASSNKPYCDGAHKKIEFKG
ncbi:MAG: (4Fe-4S)-binding protein [Bacteroidota bacterium]